MGQRPADDEGWTKVKTFELISSFPDTLKVSHLVEGQKSTTCCDVMTLKQNRILTGLSSTLNVNHRCLSTIRLEPCDISSAVYKYLCQKPCVIFQGVMG